MKYAYEEIYRGMGFHLTTKGYWFLSDNPTRSFCRYVTKNEEEGLTKGSGKTIDEQAAMMRCAIDRYRNGQVVWTGDLREPRDCQFMNKEV